MDQDLSAFVADRFEAIHAARPHTDFPRWRRIDDRTSRPFATLGYRDAADGPLFLETYLDERIERILSAAIGRSVAREAIVEIGCLAATPSPALLRLWRDTAEELRDSHAFAVATLTRPLRQMFARIGLPLTLLAAADPTRLADASGWGHYYELDPQVCAGPIREGAERLAGYAARMVRR